MTMHLNGKEIFSHRNEIAYLLGQLKIVHDKKKSFFLSDGFLNYHGQKWTSNNLTLYALYFMGIASTNMYLFKNINGKLVSEFYVPLKPTFFPPKKEDREPGDD